MFQRKDLINKAIRKRFAVTLAGSEGSFAGILTESDPTTWVFEHCSTPQGEDIAGRVFIDRINVAYLQELP